VLERDWATYRGRGVVFLGVDYHDLGSDARRFVRTHALTFPMLDDGSGNVTGPGSSTAGHVATFADATGRVLADGGAPVGAANTITPAMLTNAAVAFGVGMLNGTLAASVAGNALTIAVKTLAGVDPSLSDPVFFLFRDAVAGYAVIEQTAALSITVPAGATLGTVNGQANRIWVGVFNNGGTAVLGVYNSLSLAGSPAILSIVSWDETSPANGTGITSSATVGMR